MPKKNRGEFLCNSSAELFAELHLIISAEVYGKVVEKSHILIKPNLIVSKGLIGALKPYLMLIGYKWL